MIDTGWTWDQVGRLTVPRFLALAREWRKTPPLARLLATVLGIRADASPRGDLAGPSPKGDLISFVRAMTGHTPP